jgi:hypothetical protein
MSVSSNPLVAKKFPDVTDTPFYHSSAISLQTSALLGARTTLGK